MISKITIENFDNTYSTQGGVDKLIEMYKSGLSTSDISRHFNITPKQVNYYLKRIIGDNYLRYPWRKLDSDLNEFAEWRRSKRPRQ